MLKNASERVRATAVLGHRLWLGVANFRTVCQRWWCAKDTQAEDYVNFCRLYVVVIRSSTLASRFLHVFLGVSQFFPLTTFTVHWHLRAK